MTNIQEQEILKLDLEMDLLHDLSEANLHLSSSIQNEDALKKYNNEELNKAQIKQLSKARADRQLCLSKLLNQINSKEDELL